MTDHDLGTLFFHPTDIGEGVLKVAAATYQLSGSPDGWTGELTELLYKQHPYLTKLGRVFLHIDTEDRERGYLQGWFIVDNGQDEPLPAQNPSVASGMSGQDQVGDSGVTKRIRIPVLVESRRAYPFDAFITSENKFLPATEQRLSQALFDVGVAMTAPKSSMEGGPRAPGVQSPWGSLPTGAAWRGGQYKMASAQTAILSFEGGDFYMHDAGAETRSRVPDSALTLDGGIPKELRKTAAAVGAVLLGDVGSELPLADSAGPAMVGLEKVASSGPPYPAVLSQRGRPVLGFVVPEPIALDGRTVSVPMAITTKTACLQDSLAARPQQHTDLPLAHALSEGWEKVAGLSGVIASGGKFTPLVRVEATTKDGAVISGGGLGAQTAHVKLAAGDVGGIIEIDGHVVLDSRAEFYPLRDGGGFDTEDTPMDLDGGMYKAAELTYLDGDYYCTSPDNEHTGPMSAVSTVAWLAGYGDSPAGIARKMKTASGSPGLSVAFYVMPMLEKVAEHVIALPEEHMNEANAGLQELHQHGDIVKQAALAIAPERKRSARDTIDAVLDLGFVTPENVRYFADRSSMVEAAVSFLAEALIAARMGVPLPEAQIAAAMRAMDRTAQAMARLRVRLAADAALSGTGMTS